MNKDDEYIQHVELSFNNAQNNISKLNSGILSMEGLSGKKTRHLYNNVCSMNDTRYLEVGTWKGSSVCSAFYKNNIDVVCIDNWSELGGPKSEFIQNVLKYKGNLRQDKFKYIEDDCFKVDISKLNKFNVYLYDGNHTEESHYMALTYYIKVLDDVFIYIVDDWNWPFVRDGTRNAIKDLNLTIVYEKEIRTTMDDTCPPDDLPEKINWWNGVYVAILKKS